MAITNPTDYTGRYAITKNKYNLLTIQQFIDLNENSILNNLFGVELFELYETGIIATDPIYTKLQDPFFYQTDCGKVIESKGVKDMLLGFIYFKYYAERYAQASVNGNVVDNPENSVKANDMDSNLIARQNEAVRTYRAIQEYIIDNLDVYPTFKGQRKLLTNWF